MELTEGQLEKVISAQRNEITHHLIYKMLAKSASHKENANLLSRIADEELRHVELWERISKIKARPHKLRAYFHYLICRIFGLTFGIKLMESRISNLHQEYETIGHDIPRSKSIIKEQEGHERALIGMIDEERLRYVGSVVLGLNDALIELSGVLAGLTLALQNTRLVALAGLITGVCATLSMSASQYLSTKSSGRSDSLKSAAYTGVAYLITVAALVGPYLLLKDVFTALAVMLANVLLMIMAFTFYVSVARDRDFLKGFIEMAGISLGVAGVSFALGHLLRVWMGIDI